METSRYEDRINRAIALIDPELHHDLPLDRLADEACLSRFHFHRLFSSLTFESVHALTTRLRMQRALALTTRGAKPQWKAIAAAVGFRSPDVFARAFRRQYGCAPSQFDLATWWQERPDREAALTVSQYFLRPATPLPTDFVVSIKRRPAAALIGEQHGGGNASGIHGAARGEGRVQNRARTDNPPCPHPRDEWRQLPSFQQPQAPKGQGGQQDDLIKNGNRRREIGFR